jgi:hypothetical protein
MVIFQTLAHDGCQMYRKTPEGQLAFEDFYLPFGGKLSGDNRWVRLAGLIPWDLAESFYSEQFSPNPQGPSAKPARLALGALIIKERLGVSDEEAVEQIRENPYLQYFLGFHEFRDQAPFDPSMYVHFRKRFSLEQLGQINEAIVKAEQTTEQANEPSGPDDDDDTNSNTPSDGNRGKLLIDATCAPADIRYPTDLSLVNEAREKSEQIIDTLFEPLKGSCPKPRTYRQKARRLFVAYTKNRKRSARQRRKALGQQLRFLGRNLKTIVQLAEQAPLTHLDRRQYRNLLVIQELYRQQQWMFENRCHRISGRIVSLSQPHVRPIVRGKASAPVEFGAKLSASVVDGAVFLDRLDWDPYNESGDLVAQVEAYKQRFGCYPESVHCDTIYRTRENRKFCKEHNIRMSGPALGRPPKQTAENTRELRDRKQQRRQDEIDRIPIEGKFGQGKRRFSLDRIMAKLPETSETVMATIFIVMNLERWLKKLFFALILCRWPARKQLLTVPWGEIALRCQNFLLNASSPPLRIYCHRA